MRNGRRKDVRYVAGKSIRSSSSLSRYLNNLHPLLIGGKQRDTCGEKLIDSIE